MSVCYLHSALSAGEADLVLHYVKCLVEAQIEPSAIAVIAPYNLQVMPTCFLNQVRVAESRARLVS